MIANFILDKMEQNKQDIALISENKQYKYQDILSEYLSWEKKLSQLPNNSVVAVRGSFNDKSISLILFLLNKNCIYVPISYAINSDSIQKYISVANCEYLIDLEQNDEAIHLQSPDNYNNFIKHLKQQNKAGLVLFSSGTTGEPKGVIHNVEFMLEKYQKSGKKIRSIAFLLFDHIGGFNTVMYALANGGLIVTLTSRLTDEILEKIEKYKIELLPTTPSFINMILFSRSYQNYDLSSLKIVSYGTEPMAQSTLENFHKIFPNIKLKQTYGLSEVGILETISEANDSLWIKVANNENQQVKIVDNILWVKSRTSMLGYLNYPNPFDTDGWFNTQDLVEQKNGYIKILGRQSDIINVGGEKVYPNEIESLILSIEDVNDCIVKGESHMIMGNIVTCNVFIKENASEKHVKKQIQDLCSQKLEKYKCPMKIYFNEQSFNTTRFKRKR